MEKDLTEKVLLEMSLGHLFIIWNVISEKLAGEPVNQIFTQTEMRAIWALQDLCENNLCSNGMDSMSEPEYEELQKKAAEHISSIPVEFLD